MLFDAAGFEPLTDEPWDDERVRAAIRTIVADADDAFDPVGLWPANEWDVWGSTPPMKDLYCGAGGVIWALDALARRRHAETGIDLAAAAERTLELWREAPDLAAAEIELPSARESSLLCGEAGLLLVNWRLTPRGDLADRLLQRVRENRDNEFEELLWGSPGTLLAARAMHEWTGEERWLEAWRESAEALMARRDPDGLWTQQLYGSTAAPPWPGARSGRNRARAAAGRKRVERIAPARGGGDPRPRGDRRGRAGDVAGGGGRAARSRQRKRDPPSVVPRCARDGRHRGAVPRRGAPARRRRADVAGGSTRRREGRRCLPRNGRQRLRAAEGVRSHRRRALARAGPPLRRPRPRAGRARRGRRAAPAATRCSPATRASRSSPPTVSTRPPASPFWTAGTSGSYAT